MYYNTLYQINTTLLNADRDFYQAQLAAVNYHEVFNMQGAEEYKVTQLDAFNENKDQVLDRLNTANSIAKEYDKLYTEFTSENGNTYQSAYDKFNEACNRWLSDYNFDNDEGDQATFTTDFEETRSYISDMTDIVELWADEEDAALQKSIKHSVATIIVIFLVLSILLIVAVLATASAMADGIKRVAASIDKMAEGDFVSTIERDSPINEFVAIATSADDMRLSMQAALLDVASYAKDVNEGAATTEKSVEDSQKMSKDINQAVEDIANGATSMAQDVQNTSGLTVNIGRSVESVLSSTETNTENGKTVFKNSEAVKKQLEGVKKSGALTTNMAEQVAQSVNETADLVNEISSAAEAIIGIASQTNLLALNASIEAARAGEAGRGFAVVAESIKNLAEESDTTAKKITDMLSRIVELSDRNRNLTNQIEQATQNEAKDLEKMVEAFDEMMVLLKQTEEGNQNILKLMESLNSDKDSVMVSVDSLSAISEENAASTEETSAILAQLTEYMQTIVEQANTQKRAADGLQESISKFTVE
jgi:methyl-accepting chemotaxis protein